MKFGKTPRLYFAKDFGLDDFPHPLYPDVRVKAYPSVTSITDCIKSAMAFAWWGANSAVDYIEQCSVDMHKTFTVGGDEGVSKGIRTCQCFLNEARTAYLRISKEARDKGTNIHKLCEFYLTKNRELGVLLKQSGDDEKKLFDNFVKWCEKNKPITYQTETKIIGDGYGGRFDWLCQIDGQNVLIDLKTGKSGRWYDEWPLQLSGYKNGLHPCGIIAKSAILPDTCAILKLNKDTLTVNYKDYGNCDDYYIAFKHLVNFYWAINEKEIMEEIEKRLRE